MNLTLYTCRWGKELNEEGDTFYAWGKNDYGDMIDEGDDVYAFEANEARIERTDEAAIEYIVYTKDVVFTYAGKNI